MPPPHLGPIPVARGHGLSTWDERLPAPVRGATDVVGIFIIRVGLSKAQGERISAMVPA